MPAAQPHYDGEGNIVGTGNLGGIPVGMMFPYAGSTIPYGWKLCDGSAISRETYVDLFTVIGTTYGVGDGSTTFNIPDMRGRHSLGKADSGTGSVLGGTGGNIDHTHSTGNHDNHVFTQPSGHSAHVVTQPSGHSAHVVTQPADHSALTNNHVGTAVANTSGATVHNHSTPQLTHAGTAVGTSAAG